MAKTHANDAVWSGTAMGRRSIDRLFSPNVVAVVGASLSLEKAGGVLMRVLDSFRGSLYPINPKVKEIGGRRCYARVSEIPEQTDLVVIAVPRNALVDVIEDCGKAGAGGAVICTGGLGESGRDGAALQAKVAEAAKGAGIRLLGPNTSGFIAPGKGLHATFMLGAHELQAGPLAIVAQSGGVNLAASFMAARRGCGVSLAIGLGNAVDVGFVEVLDYLADDEQTSAVALHIEGVADGRALLEAVRRVSAVKPVVALMVGEHDVSEFAKSHTGAIVGNWAVARAALSHAGAVVVNSLSDLVDAASALSVMRLPARQDLGVGIVTGQAGPGLIITETLLASGVSVPKLSPDTTRRLTELLPPLTYQLNPVDTGRPGPAFLDVVRAVGDDPAVAALVVYALQEAQTAAMVEALCDQRTRGSLPPVLVATGGSQDAIVSQREALRPAGVAALDSPDRAAFAMSALVADARAQFDLRRAESAAAASIDEIGPWQRQGLLDEHEGKKLLEQLHILTPRRAVCRDVDEAVAAFEALVKPVVVKALNADVVHKAAAGGVRLGVTDAEGLRDALAATLAPSQSPRWLVEEQAPAGIDLIIGGMRDAAFGSAVVVGAGGSGVEWGRPPALRTVPLRTGEAREIVGSLPPPLLKALGERARGELILVLDTVAHFLSTYPEVAELDINPLRAVGEHLIALDAVVRIERKHLGISPKYVKETP